MQELNTMGVYLCPSQLETIKSKIIGILFKSHSFYTCQQDVLKELKERIIEATGNEGTKFVLTPGFQTHLLLPLILWYQPHS